MRRVLWFLQALALYAVALPLGMMPTAAALRAGSFMGVAAYHLWTSRRRIAVENLGRAVEGGYLDGGADPEEIVKENFRNLGRSVAEIVKVYMGFGNGIVESVAVVGKDNFLKAQQKGRGVLLITGHCGNWELLALALSSKVSPLGAVARPINNPFFNRLIEGVRKRYGNAVIYKQGALRAMISRLRKGGTVGILIDQGVVPSEGVKVPFLGRPAWTVKSPSLIARKTGAAVVPVFLRRRDGGGHVMEILPEVPLSGEEDLDKAVLEDTARFTSHVERYVKENPAEWLWIHRRWKRA